MATFARIGTMQHYESRMVRVSDRPITFEQFLDLSGNDLMELVEGAMVEHALPYLDEQKLFGWLLGVVYSYVEARDLGIVLGSRTAVKINDFGGRLPVILFVRKELNDILQQRAVYGAPDLVVEIVSPNDRPSDIVALETEYCGIGVSEIWFIDPRKRRVQVLRRADGGYEIDDLRQGGFDSTAVDGLRIELDWLFIESRPAVRRVLDSLLESE